ncbi:sensor histidine kinase [Novosphingobium cyanobacteriorum]|uniref:sensor histidine kinase n=1 Tax=Novosphingobium cyanobacteriorum TaxID=3024215 RepID=UPI003F68B2BE
MASAAPEHEPLPHPPARQVILSAVALWLTYFVLITLRGLVAEMGEFNELLWRRALVTLAGIAVTLVAWPVLRRFDGRSLGVRVAAALVIMLPAALALAVVNQQAFAPVEARMLQQEIEKAKQEAAPAPEASDSITINLPKVQIRRDLSGNVLVDMGDAVQPARPAPVTVPEPPAPPAPPAPRVAPAPITAPAPPAPPAPDFPIAIRKNPDGSSILTAPGGVMIRRNADGTAEIRTNGVVVQTDEDEANDLARDLEEARAQAEQARGMADEARQEAEEEARQSVEDALAAAGLPAPAARSVRSKAAPAQARPAARPATRPAAGPAPERAAAKPAPQSSPSATAQPAPGSKVTVITKMVHKDEGLWRQLTDVALGRYFLLIAWAALYLALGNGEMARAAERREGEYRRAAKAAELKSLRYQVNPHFLFNTLNSLSALVMVGRSEQAERMIQTLSGFYRQSLTADPTADVPLADEIALQRAYLEIEAVRFPERLRCEFDIPPALENACVPGMILQPLVENSIKYAVSATTRPVTIRITAREAEGLLVLTVADDGPGGGATEGGTGIGLANVRNRLEARFAEKGSAEGGPLPAGGYATVLTLPVVWKDC